MEPDDTDGGGGALGRDRPGADDLTTVFAGDDSGCDGIAAIAAALALCASAVVFGGGLIQQHDEASDHLGADEGTTAGARRRRRRGRGIETTRTKTKTGRADGRRGCDGDQLTDGRTSARYVAWEARRIRGRRLPGPRSTNARARAAEAARHLIVGLNGGDEGGCSGYAGSRHCDRLEPPGVLQQESDDARRCLRAGRYARMRADRGWLTYAAFVVLFLTGGTPWQGADHWNSGVDEGAPICIYPAAGGMSSLDPPIIYAARDAASAAQLIHGYGYGPPDDATAELDGGYDLGDRALRNDGACQCGGAYSSGFSAGEPLEPTVGEDGSRPWDFAMTHVGRECGMRACLCCSKRVCFGQGISPEFAATAVVARVGSA